MKKKVLFAALGLVAGALAIAPPGCAYLNGDALWLSADQKEVSIRKRRSTFGDVEYVFREGNLPFCFKLRGVNEFGHIGHSAGSPDLTKGGYVAADSLLRFSIRKATPEIDVAFLVSNGVVRVVGAKAQECRVERRTGMGGDGAVPIGADERWEETALGRSIGVTVWDEGFSIHIHRLGEYGIVYNYVFPSGGSEGETQLWISEIANMRWFHWASL